MAKVLQIKPSPEAEIPLRIGDLAKRSGKSTRALRLYEDLNLLGPVIRTDGGHRLYSTAALLRLHWIDKLQLLGFSLADIRAFLEHLQDDRLGPVAMEYVRQTFTSKLEQVRGRSAAWRCSPPSSRTASSTCARARPATPATRSTSAPAATTTIRCAARPDHRDLSRRRGQVMT